MSMSAKNKHEFLGIEDRSDGFVITANKKQAAELDPLFHQYGIECRLETDTDKDVLVFGAGVDRAKVEEILLGYETTTGS
jgi:hypothetical protein